MTEARTLLAERAALAGATIPPELSDRLLAYYALLVRWNRKINLTSLSDPLQAIDRLLLEPVLAAPHLPRGPYLVDLGSGGGSPAIPLALSLEARQLVMVESRSRKAAFLREAAREVGVKAIVEAVRFETLENRPEFDRAANIVSIRAVAPTAETMRIGRRMLNADGKLACFGSGPSVAPATGLEQDSSHHLLGAAYLVLMRRRDDVPRGT